MTVEVTRMVTVGVQKETDFETKAFEWGDQEVGIR